MTKGDRATALARKALSLIHSGKIIPWHDGSRNIILKNHNRVQSWDYDKQKEKVYSKALDGNFHLVKACHTGVVGALLIAHMLFFKGYDIEDLRSLTYWANVNSILEKYFGYRMYHSICLAYFDATAFYMPDDWSDDGWSAPKILDSGSPLNDYAPQCRDSVRFCRSFPEYEDRMIAILQNIIDHGGVFDPSEEYEMV